MLNNKKAVLFDLDGTLVDSMWVWVEIDAEYAVKYNLTYPDDFHEQIEGMSFSETAAYFKENFNMPITVEQIMEEWKQMAYETYCTKVMYKPGAKEFLDYLYEHQIKTAICTSNSRQLVDALQTSLPELARIDVVMTACDVNAGKPAPDVYLKAAELLGAAPSDCLVFEDIPQGIMAGKNAQMDVCAVEDSFSADLSEEKKKLADYYITDYRQMLSDGPSAVGADVPLQKGGAV